MRQDFAGWAMRAALFFMVLNLSAVAAAYEETEGIRFGFFSVHPSVYSALRYNDNIYFVADDFTPTGPGEVPQQKETDLVVNLQPAVAMRIKTPRLNLEAGYRFYNDHYLGYDDPDDRHAKLDSSNHTFNGLMKYEAPVGLFMSVDDTFVDQQAFEESEDYIDQIRGDQQHNEAHGVMGLKRGPENNFYLAGGYTLIDDRYEKVDDYDRQAWSADGDLRLKFLPRTALLFLGGYGEVSYPNLEGFDSNMTYYMGGFGGQITNVIHLRLMGGFQQNEYMEEESFEGPVGLGEISAIWGSETNITLGVRRRILDSSTTNYYTSDEVFLRFYRLWFQRLTTEGFASYQSNEFSEPFAHTENFVQFKFDAMLRMIFWMHVGGGYQYDGVDFKDDVASTTTTRNVLLGQIMAKF